MLTPRGKGAKEAGRPHINHRTEKADFTGEDSPQRNVAQTRDIYSWKYTLKNKQIPPDTENKAL